MGCTWFGVRSFKTLIQILFLFIFFILLAFIAKLFLTGNIVTNQNF